MKMIVLVVLGLFTAWIWLAVDQDSDVGKDPRTEVMTYGHERSTVTGEILKTEIVQCKRCGEILSFCKFDYRGRCVFAHHNMHRCGQYGIKPIARSVMDVEVNFLDWLEEWQRRLQLKR